MLARAQPTEIRRLAVPVSSAGICVSGTVRDHIGERLPYAFERIDEVVEREPDLVIGSWCGKKSGLSALRRDLASTAFRRCSVNISTKSNRP